MPWLAIEQWDEAGRLLNESHGIIESPASILAALLPDSPHTVTVELQDETRGSLLLAARHHWVLVGWSDLEYQNYHLASDSTRDDQIEMFIGGLPTLVPAADLVSAATAELAIREFLGDGRGSMGLTWNLR